MKILMLIGFAFIGICAGIWIIIIVCEGIQIINIVWETPQQLSLIEMLFFSPFIFLPYFAGRFLYRKMNALYCRSGQPE